MGLFGAVGHASVSVEARELGFDYDRPLERAGERPPGSSALEAGEPLARVDAAPAARRQRDEAAVPRAEAQEPPTAAPSARSRRTSGWGRGSREAIVLPLRARRGLLRPRQLVVPFGLALRERGPVAGLGALLDGCDRLEGGSLLGRRLLERLGLRLADRLGLGAGQRLVRRDAAVARAGSAAFGQRLPFERIALQRPEKSSSCRRRRRPPPRPARTPCRT